MYTNKIEKGNHLWISYVNIISYFFSGKDFLKDKLAWPPIDDLISGSKRPKDFPGLRS